MPVSALRHNPGSFITVGGQRGRSSHTFTISTWMVDSNSTIRSAYAACRRLARRHYENFPVASYLVPRDKRDALAAIYAFARTADDFADEPGVEGRLASLADWRRKLNECFAREPLQGALARSAPPSPRRVSAGGLQGPSPTDSIFVALGDAARRFELSQQHFENLLRAFALDVTMNRHRDFSSLLAYCSCSANPVGRLMLELFGHRDPELWVLSDNLCTALQLTNFWQDVAVDFERDRIYLPLEDLARFNYSLDDLRAQRADERWMPLMAFEVERTREFFERSRPLPEKVAPSLRRQLRLTWLGGMMVLRKIEAAGYDVFRRRPKLGHWNFFRLWMDARRPLDGRQSAAERAPAAVSRS